MELMVPHILNWEVGLKPGEKALQGEVLYNSVAKRGYHVIPGDKGEQTMCGVTLKTFKEWRKKQGKPVPTVEDLKALQYDEWIAILKQMFWDPCKADQINNQSIAQMIVDWRWVNGNQAVRDAQAVLSCVADGIVGPKTLAALNAPEAQSVFNRLKNARIRAYDRIVARSPSQKKFYNGWLNRTNSITYKN